MSWSELFALTDSKVVLAVFRPKGAPEAELVPLGEILSYKKVDPVGFASLADDCRAHLLTSLD